jgi:hypothetical protein
MWSRAVHHHGDYGAVYGVSTPVSTQHSRLFDKIGLFFTPMWSASHQQYPSRHSCDSDLSGHEGRSEFAYFYNKETKKTHKTKRQSTKKKLKKGTKIYEKKERTKIKN